MKQIVFLNGNFINAAKAGISVFDRGFLYGDGVFETMRAYNGKVFALGEHLGRMRISLKILKIDLPYSLEKIAKLIDRTIVLNKLSDAYVKVVITRGQGAPGVDISENAKATVVIYASKLAKLPQAVYERGIAVTFPCIRRNPESFTARIKSLNYVDNILARNEVREEGFFEPIFLNTLGKVTEGATTNIFIIKGDRIITPPPTAGLLPGVTRKVLIGLIKKYLNNRIEEKDISVKDMISADEIFLTNSTSELIPVIRVGKGKIGKGVPGPFYKFLSIIYKAETGSL